jgi:cytochrome c oxidase assembly factor 6
MAYGLPDWLTGSSSTPSQPAAVRPKSKDGGYVAPDRNAREVCYESRDIFFECLDKNNILDAVREDEKSRQVCPQEVKDYERDCARSWVCQISRYVAFDGMATKILLRQWACCWTC